jgi:phytoene dehydrogenase-like protein
LKQSPVVIVGAGLAGLTCARELQRRGVPFVIHEASDGPGGRVRTDLVDGFRLDRGFQVYLTAYPEGQKQLDYAALRFGRFLPGTLVRYGGRFHRVMDPWREPFAALSNLLNPVGSMADKLRIARLRASCMAGSLEDILQRPESTSMEALLDYGFTSNIIERFFQPFFGGIMLDSQLRPSSRFMEYVFRMMAEGDTVLPALGMGAIPQQLADALPVDSIRYGSRVQAISPSEVKTANGETVPASAVVVATEGPEANRLLPGLAHIDSRKVYSMYFAIEGPPPVPDALVVMNGNLEWPIHNLCVPSVVCPDYAPPGHHLLSVSVLGDPNQGAAVVETRVRSQLARWFGSEANHWRLLRTYRILHAHPYTTPSKLEELPVRLDNGVYICGDHRYFPSINAAMENGRHAGDAVARQIFHA